MIRRPLFGICAVMLSAIGYSTKAIFAKLAYRFGADAITVLTLRMLFSAPLLLVVLFCHRGTRARLQALSRRDIFSLAGIGLIGFYLSAAFDFAGLQYISASLERIVLFSYPAIVVVLSTFLLRTKLRPSDLVALVFCYGGIILSFFSEISLGGKGVLWGALLVGACAFTYSFYILASARYIPKVGSLTFTSLALLFATIAVLLQFVAQHHLKGLVQPSAVYLLCGIMAVVSTVLPGFMLSAGIEHTGASTAAIVSSIGPIVTIALADYFLGEHTGLMQWIGGALVIIGVLSISTKRTSQAANE